ncbi:nuclear transport factor 2 family protein [Maritimibacter sp. UBA3975]|uniref:nuclear transport factor 2 family protein n=1 Tax=Maritimibacter sp. UBA3975 TaxID=1946833 RepID=UPI0025C53FFD|nr:nuclear transport factor 2 family protein [Maritimibacter sp. UBA3975]|tara:strand:+ start:2631 stop:3023 length:393 start_codon:yes stop_codon:yes gene_type:complete
MDDTTAKLAILERIAAYGDAVNRRDGAAWIDCWTQDALWSIRDREIAGAPAILSAWETAMAGYAAVHFFSHLGRVEVSGDAATARVYTVEYLTTTGGEARTQFGEYDDLFRYEGGTWRFAHRAFRVREAR